MTNKLFPIIAVLALAMPIFPQQKGAEKQEKNAAPDSKMAVWQEVVLEDFETTPYTNKDLSFSAAYDQEAGISIRTDLPATPGSKKYLGLKIKTRGSDSFVIRPPREIIIDRFCKSISIWVFGEKTNGEISIMLQDANNVNHRLVMAPVINFKGWKQFTVLLTDKVYQGSVLQNKKNIMKITNIQYRTTTMTTTGSSTARWEYVYVDDITATVKEATGTGKQNDQW